MQRHQPRSRYFLGLFFFILHPLLFLAVFFRAFASSRESLGSLPRTFRADGRALALPTLYMARDYFLSVFSLSPRKYRETVFQWSS